jgi:sec-independent protein translocase protein TatB
MFDVSFSEILVIALVALIVIGPEKLPKVARTLGLLTGRMQRYVASVKADIDRELRMEDLRKMEEDAKHSILNLQSDVHAGAAKVEEAVKSATDEVKTAAQPPDHPQTPV